MLLFDYSSRHKGIRSGEGTRVAKWWLSRTTQMHTGAAHRQDMVNLLDVYIRCNETCHLKPSSLQLRRLHCFCRRPFSDFLKRFSKNKMVFIENCLVFNNISVHL